MPLFNPADRVHLKANPERSGVIAGVLEDPGGGTQYDVFFSADEIRTFPEAALIAPDELDQPAGPIELLKRWQLGDADQFRSFLTLAKLTSPIADNLYSFLASRTELLPYQFKPVLKLIESPYPRMLIADEVGLGKTIEAGIILTELNARLRLNRVLIVCPSSLLNKWRSELRERFDWEFTVHDGPSLRDGLAELSRLGDAAPFRGIASLELMRRAENLEALDDAKPRLDVVIVDEAHHMRNSGTMSNTLGDYLSSLSETMLFLTATPLNLGERDFFELLRLLVPQEFNDFEIFRSLLEPNEPINESLRILRRDWPPDFAAAESALRRVAETSQGARYARNVRYRDAVARLERAAGGADVDREWGIDTQRIIAELNTLSHVFTRTKKREVSEHFPTRSAHKLDIEFTTEERRFYDAVTAWAHHLYNESGMPVGFVTIAFQRQAASCIWAMGAKMEESLALSTASFMEEEIIDLEDEVTSLGSAQVNRREVNPIGVAEPLDVAELEAELPQLAESKLILEIQQAWTAVKRSGVDTKFDVLAAQLKEIFDGDPNAKVLIFSFFIRTIDYLEERLAELDLGDAVLGVRKIYGPTGRDQRHQVINDFRTSSGPQVLISSEVGAEGLDFQFCSRMVNYDLPWNPMRVEQRIGRLDRYGQQAELIEIFNPVIKDSIEDRIFYRLYDRIEIFKRSIGDLEAILGSEIGVLQRDILTGRLTEEQQDERTNQIANAIVNLQREHEEFDEQSKKFVGVDEVFTDRFNDIREGERYISPAELQNFVERFLAKRFPKVKLSLSGEGSDDRAPAFELIGSEDENFISFLNEAYFEDPHKSREHYRLLIRLQHGERCALTFDGRTAMIDRTLEFLSIHHPIVRAIVLALDQDEQAAPPTGHLVLGPSADEVGEGLEPGNRLFFIYELSIRGLRDEIELAAVAVHPDGTIDQELSERFLLLVRQARSVNGADRGGPHAELLSDEVVDRCAAAAREWAGRRVEQTRVERDRIVSSSVDMQLESLRLSHERRIATIREQLSEAERQHQASIARMRRGQLTNVERYYEEKTRELQGRRGVEVSHRNVGAGLLSVLA